MKILINKSGLVLAETLLTVAMLATASIVGANLIHGAVTTTLTAKNYMIAQNLATEAVEAVKTIRTTNWLRNLNDNTCWLTLDPDTQCGDKVVPGANISHYIPIQKVNGQWKLEPSGITAELNLENGEAAMEPYRLCLEQFSVSGQTYQKYIHKTDCLPSSQSVYFRSINFEEITGVDSLEVLNFTVKVQWKEGAKIMSIVEINEIYNH